MLSVGDIANLELALENTIKVVEGVNAMKEPVIGAVSYPLFLMVFVVLMIYMVGVYMVPPMVDAVPSLVWKGTAKSLVDLSTFVAKSPDFVVLYPADYRADYFMDLSALERPFARDCRSDSTLVHLPDFHRGGLVVVFGGFGARRNTGVQSIAFIAP